MKKLLTIASIIIVTGCSSAPKVDVRSSSNVDNKNTKPAETLYIDLSASERCKIKEHPYVKEGKIQLKPVLDEDGNWLCDTKPVTYWITLSVKNTKNQIKEYKLECDNPYGLMKECKGWNAWSEELGPGPFVIETKGQPEVESKFIKPMPERFLK